MCETRIETVGNIEYSLLYRWRENDPLTKFVACMLFPAIPVGVLQLFMYGEMAALRFLICWIGVVCIAAGICKRYFL